MTRDYIRDTGAGAGRGGAVRCDTAGTLETLWPGRIRLWLVAACSLINHLPASPSPAPAPAQAQASTRLKVAKVANNEI